MSVPEVDGTAKYDLESVGDALPVLRVGLFTMSG
jgi:hypothetical protein